MSVRESMSRHPRMAALAVAIVVLGCLTFAWSQLRGGGLPGPAKSFYTTDDSSQDAAMAALFKGDWNKWPPFDHNGKQAYRALVFSADDGKTKFIGYLEKLSPEGKQMIADIESNSAGTEPAKLLKAEYNVAQYHTLVKKPGDSEWVPEGRSPESQQAMHLTAPPGQDAANLKSVFP